MAYKRVLLKVSGEQLSGTHEFGIDPAVARYIATEIKKVQATGCQVAVVVGGGNMVRGAELAQETGIRRVTADQMGMLSGLMNAMALTDIFEAEGLPTRCLSNLYAEQAAENYSYRLAEKHLQNNRVVLIAGGIGRPYSTHDIGAVSLGLELGCDVTIKATKVDGVYDKDPVKFPDAKRFDSLSLHEAAQHPDIKVMDRAALGLALENNMSLIIYEFEAAGALLDIVNGKAVGTKVS